MDARCSSGWILSRHAEDQGPDILAYTLSASHSSDSGEPSPVEPEARPMPSHNRSRCDHDERLLPSVPKSLQGDPEQLVHGRESATRQFGVQDKKLLAKGQIFENKFLTGTEGADNPTYEVPEKRDHGQHGIGTPSTRVPSKLFILRVREVLTRHRSFCGPQVAKDAK